MTENTDVVYECNQCDKKYAIKSSFQSHLRLKHRANKDSEAERAESGGNGNPYRLATGGGNKKKTPEIWVDNERGMPLMTTRDLDSFL